MIRTYSSAGVSSTNAQLVPGSSFMFFHLLILIKTRFSYELPCYWNLLVNYCYEVVLFLFPDMKWFLIYLPLDLFLVVHIYNIFILIRNDKFNLCSKSN